MKDGMKKSKFKYFNTVDIGNSLAGGIDTSGFADSFGDLVKKRESGLFLGKYNETGVMNIIRASGMTSQLRKNGFDDIRINIHIDSAGIHNLKLFDGKETSKNLIIDVRLSEFKFLPDESFFESKDAVGTYDMFVIEWLSIQNPRSGFNSDRPQLPGQVKPGLGLLKYCFRMMHIIASDVNKDGFMDVPDHIHGAIMYSREFRFFNPAHDGVLKALMRDLKDYSLADISWGILTETIIESYKNLPQKYDPSEQIFYVSDKLRKYFQSSKYRNTFRTYYRRKKFYFKYEEMQEKRAAILARKKIADL